MVGALPGTGGSMAGATTPTRLVDRVPLWWLVTGLVVTTVGTFAADVVWPLLAHDHPLLLMVLSSRGRHLLLVASRVDLLPFVGVGVTRLLVGDLFAFALGRRYGDRAIDYLVRRSGRRAPQARRAVAFTRRAAPLAVWFGAGNILYAIVGATGMRPRRFFLLDGASTLISVTMTHVAGDAFASPISAALTWVGHHQWPVTGGMLAVVLGALVWRRARSDGRGTLRDVVEELEHLDHELPAPEPT